MQVLPQEHLHSHAGLLFLFSTRRVTINLPNVIPVRSMNFMVLFLSR